MRENIRFFHYFSLKHATCKA